MPRVFVAPGSKTASEFKTVYLGVRGDKAAFTGVEGVEIRSFTDGTSKTITVVEANDNSAVIWTKPNDFAIDTPNPITSLVGLREGGFLVAFADGHVQLISDTAPANVIKALFTRNGGEVVDLNAVSR